MSAAWALLPQYLGWHVLLSASALVLGVLISLPLAVAAARSPRLRWPVLALASLIQTIPSLALLALFYPLLLLAASVALAWCATPSRNDMSVAIAAITQLVWKTSSGLSARR